MSILCRLGFHVWAYFHMSVEFIQMFGSKPSNISRRCLRCGYMQCRNEEDDGWVTRL